MEIKKIITIQGIELKISIEDNGAYYAPQWIKNTYESEDSFTFDAFLEMVSFTNPIKALKEIGLEILDLSNGLDKPIYFIGSNDKRTRVYARMLKKCGINFREVFEPIDGDLALEIL